MLLNGWVGAGAMVIRHAMWKQFIMRAYGMGCRHWRTGGDYDEKPKKTARSSSNCNQVAL